MVRNIHERESNITIFVSHNMNDIAKLSTRVLVMDHGKLAMNGTPEEVFSREAALKRMGLALPDAMEFISRLREKGMIIESHCMEIGELADEIAKRRK